MGARAPHPHLHGGIAPDVPVDSMAENHEKHARCRFALETLRRTLESAKPDVIILFGDDQSEQFDFKNYPALESLPANRIRGLRFQASLDFRYPTARDCLARRRRSIGSPRQDIRRSPAG